MNLRSSVPFYLIIALVAITLNACKDKEAVIIKGSVQNIKDVKTVFLLKPDTMQSVTYSIVDSAKVSNGEFVFKFSQVYPDFYELLIGGARVDIIVRNGEEVKLKIDLADSTGDYQISGSKDSEKMMELRNVNQNYSAKISNIENGYYSQLAKATTWADSDAVMTKYDIPHESTRQAYSEELLKFIKQNSSSMSGFYAALQLDRNKYEQQLIAYADTAKKYFSGNLQVNKFIRDIAFAMPLSVGHKAPDFSFSDANGKTVSTSDYKGKYVLIDFWASWNKPSRHLNPGFVRVYNKFKAEGFDVLGLSLNNDKKNWLTAIAADHLPWRQLCDFKRFGGEVVRLYKVDYLPLNFLIDPQGNIVAKNLSITELEDFLNQTLSKVNL